MIRFALALLALVFWFSAAYAEPGDPFGKALMARIKSEGFRIESIKTTFLRRIQIDSRSSRKRRQTVYNPVTGDVLQDRILELDEESFLASVSEFFAIDIRSGREGRGGGDQGKGKIGKSGADKGKSEGKGNSGQGNTKKGKPN